MANRQLERWQMIERSITKKYRKELWSPFTAAMKRYEMVAPGDCVAVCISGGKDSMLMAKLMQMLQRFSDIPYTCEYLVMDPGYSAPNRQRIEQNAALLNIPVTVFESDIFRVTDGVQGNPCYLCARMRRGHLYAKAREMGCNKIALGHHLNDVIETTVLAMFYGAQLQGMMPKLHSTNFEGMELIRPLYCVREDDIIAWARYNGLEFIRCACRMTEKSSFQDGASKRQEIKALIRELRKTNPDIETNIFNAVHAVTLDTFPAWKSGGLRHSFLECYDEKGVSEED
ncbi:MAG: tRNA 2-thiocytidine biosynthesis protein TtcA [Clostridia bacterium]|nr:tRNA 2-thiocytidine biosynthesis protein TtcA [Clostridia bacterium]